MIDMHPYTSNRDQNIDRLKLYLPRALKDINDLCNKCINCGRNSNYADNDLRKTIFAKLYLLFVNFAMHVELILEKEYLSKIIIKWQLFNVPADYLENFFKFAMRSLYSETIELVDHLLASVLESHGKKDKDQYMSFSKMLKEMEEQGIVCFEDKNFLQEWMDKQRNPRHRNYEDHFLGGKTIEYEFPHDFENFNKLIDIIKKMVSHSAINNIFLVEDRNPR
jgi:hypothetical protein